MKLLFLMLILSSSVNASPQVPSEFNPKYFTNHTKNIWLFPDWPFYKPTGISKGSEVHVSNDNFTTYKQGKFWSGTVDWDYQLVSVNGFDMPTNYRGWPTYRIDTDILNSYTYIRLADGSTPVEPPPVIEEPEPPVIEEPEPEVPPVVEEPEPPVVEEPEPPVVEEPEPPVVEEPELDLNPHPEAEYIQCAWENNTCTLPDNTIATIRYGRTVFTYMEGLSGAVQCSNSVFGDPEFGVGKRCAYYVTESIPPVIEEPEPPVIVEPEPEVPPVVEEPEPPVTPEPEYPPVASFTYSPSEVFTDTVVTLDGSASENAVSYVWDDAAGSFGQWPLGEGQIIEFVFYNPGIKQPRLTVTNEAGETHTMVQVFEAKLPVTPEPEPPVIVEPEPEPEPPVIVEPEPEVPPVVEPINKAQLYGLMTRIENLLNTEDPRAAFSTAANMMRDKADLLERVGILKQLISEAE